MINTKKDLDVRFSVNDYIEEVLKPAKVEILMMCSMFMEELYNEGYWSEVFSDMYWRDEFSTKTCLDIFLTEAKNRKITLMDQDNWDYDTEFYESYKADSDKGLS